MTDEHLDHLVRDADPYRPEIIGRLDGAEQILLEEIMSEPNARPQRSLLRRSAVALAAAAVVTGLFATSALLRTQQDGPAVTPAPAETKTELVYTAAVLEAAAKNPRLLIDEPGWKAATVYGFAKQEGTIAFDNGGRTLEMNWYRAKYYGDFRLDRKEVSVPEPVQVAGQQGNLYRYSASDFAVMLPPRDGAFVELRTKQEWDRETFDRVLTRIKRVDVRTWLAALPPEIVTPGRAAEAARKVLAGVPLPPGFDASKLEDGGANDPYQFGAKATGLVGCGWISEWKRATKAHDKAAVRRAADAMGSSHGWKVLHDMNAEGDWPEVFWDIADKIVDGDLPKGYESGIGCVK